jgi:cytidylate kinase
MRERDRIDSSRRLSPLRPAADAVQLDTTEMAPDEVLGRLLLECENRGIKAAARG